MTRATSIRTARIMRSGILVAFFAISFAIRIAIGGTASAATFADCVRDAAGRDLVAKTAFQRGMRDLVVQRRPAFRSLATVNMELQIAYAEARRSKLDYLLKHDAGRIETTRGLVRFTNFAWSDADTEKFIEESSSYRELDKRLATLKERNNGHPDWPKMRQYFRTALGQSPDFRALMARFQAGQRDVTAVISRCRRS